jgi:hypothetical protein
MRKILLTVGLIVTLLTEKSWSCSMNYNYAPTGLSDILVEGSEEKKRRFRIVGRTVSSIIGLGSIAAAIVIKKTEKPYLNNEDSLNAVQLSLGFFASGMILVGIPLIALCTYKYGRDEKRKQKNL